MEIFSDRYLGGKFWILLLEKKGGWKLMSV